MVCSVTAGGDWDRQRGTGPYGGAWYPPPPQPQPQPQPQPYPGYYPYPPPPGPRSSGAVIAVVVVVFVVTAAIAAGAVAFISTRHHDSRTGANSTRNVTPASHPDWVPITIDNPVPGTTPLPAELSATSLADGVVVTPALAQSVVQAIWSLREQAFTSRDRSFLAEFESGPALESDEGTCGCNSRTPRGPIRDEVVFVPRQATYPATFLAEVSTTLAGSAYAQYLVLSKVSPASTWTVVADPGDSAAPLDRPTTDAAGYDIAPTPAAATRAFPASLAAYWQTWVDTGHRPASSPFADGPWTTSHGAKLASQPQGSLVSANGLDGRYIYQSTPADPTWAFGTAGGGITCGVLRAQTLWNGPGGAAIYQPPDQTNWGPTVAPGTYHGEAETSIVQPCFIQHSNGPVTITSGDLDADTEQGIDPYTVPAATAPAPAAATPVPASCVESVPYEQTEPMSANQAYNFELPTNPAPCLATAGLTLGPREPDSSYEHVHIDIDLMGGAVAVPAGIGTQPSTGQVTGLFTTSDTGIVWYSKTHTYTLGQLFEEWGQPLGPSQIGEMRTQTSFQIYWFVNGTPVANPATFALHNHDEIFAIEDEAGAKIAPTKSFAWPPGY
jgi:hypothetical protein